VPFCCFKGGNIPVFVDKQSGGKATFTIIEGAMGVALSLAIPVAGSIVAGVYAILKYLTNWLNLSLNKKRMQAEQIKIMESSVRVIAYGIQAAVECRLPWCEKIAEMQTWPLFATNSTTFGSAGPEVGKESIGAYIAMAELGHKDRLTKAPQAIITAVPSTPGLGSERDERHRLYDGKLDLMVPNVEHFWMGDKVIIDNDPSKIFTVAHRWGRAEKHTWDCDNLFVDNRVIPDGYFKEKRGCGLTFTAGYGEGRARSYGGSKSGYNIRGILGTGHLLMQEDYSPHHAAYKGKTVSLYRKKYTIPTPGGGGPDPKNPFSKLIPLDRQIVAGFLQDKSLVKQALIVAITAGVGGYMLYQGLNKS